MKKKNHTLNLPAGLLPVISLWQASRARICHSLMKQQKMLNIECETLSPEIDHTIKILH